MKTVTDNILEMRRELAALLESLAESSSVRERNHASSYIDLVGPSFAWCDLSLEAKRVQSKFFDEYNSFFELLKALLGNRPAGIRAEVEAGDEEIRKVVAQAEPTYYTKEEAFAAVRLRLDAMVTAVGDLYDPYENSLLVVPDTNALLYNPDLEDWSYPGHSGFTVVLVPEVLRELDVLKIGHRNPDVRDRSESIIRRIGEYGRRGRLDKGVPLRKGVSQIRSVAPEPKMKHALSWLDPENSDDRILASFVEVMRAHPRSAVVLVTRDVNLCNKAGFARLPFESPPDKNVPKRGEAHNTGGSADG